MVCVIERSGVGAYEVGCGGQLRRVGADGRRYRGMSSSFVVLNVFYLFLNSLTRSSLPLRSVRDWNPLWHHSSILSCLTSSSMHSSSSIVPSGLPLRPS